MVELSYFELLQMVDSTVGRLESVFQFWLSATFAAQSHSAHLNPANPVGGTIRVLGHMANTASNPEVFDPINAFNDLSHWQGKYAAPNP